jgi:hypothetical protein
MTAISRFLPLLATGTSSLLSVSPVVIRGTAWFVAMLVVGWVLASWFWQIASPDAAPTARVVPLLDHQAAAKLVASRHLFGRASSAGDESDADRATVDFRLMGAMTASPEVAGFAILSESGKPSVAVLEGETFLPGVTLLEVLPRQVRLKIGERVETIDMPESAASPMVPGDAGSAGHGVSVERDMSAPPRPNNNPRPERPRP